MSKVISNKKYLFLIAFCIILGTVLRAYLIQTEKYSVQSSYSTHAKTALNYQWIRNDLSHQSCKLYDQKELFDRFYRLDSSTFSYKRLYAELEESNHPPLYYILAHFLHSQNKTGYPNFKLMYWMNLLFSFFAMLLFYLVLVEIIKDKFFIFIGMFWYCTSFGLASFVLFHKAYDLQLMLSFFVTWLVIKQNRKDSLQFKDYSLFSFLCFLLFNTHYISYLFVSMLFVWIHILNKYFRMRPNRIKGYFISTLIASLGALILVPFSIMDILTHGYDTYNKSAGIGFDKALDISNQVFSQLLNWPILLSIALLLY